DHQVKFRRLLYGQIGRLTPFQNLVNQSSGVSAVGSKARSVGHKTPGVYELSPSVDRRQPIFCRQVYDPLLIRVGQWVQCHRESRAAGVNRFFERALEFVGAAYPHRIEPESQFSCRLFTFLPLWRGAGVLWVPQHGNAGELGTVSLSNSNRFPDNTGAMLVNPVILPPG